MHQIINHDRKLINIFIRNILSCQFQLVLQNHMNIQVGITKVVSDSLGKIGHVYLPTNGIMLIAN